MTTSTPEAAVVSIAFGAAKPPEAAIAGWDPYEVWRTRVLVPLLANEAAPLRLQDRLSGTVCEARDASHRPHAPKAGPSLLPSQSEAQLGLFVALLALEVAFLIQSAEIQSFGKVDSGGHYRGHEAPSQDRLGAAEGRGTLSAQNRERPRLDPTAAMDARFILR